MKKYICSKDLYLKFLKVTCSRYSAFSLSEVSPISLSHDAVSRWLRDSKCQPKDIWDKARECVLETSGVLIADETVISKNRSNKIELVRYLYSGNEHDIVRGIGLLTSFGRKLVRTASLPHSIIESTTLLKTVKPKTIILGRCLR